jgi:ATP-dependent Clp protease ATP-binding subunit ClpB
VILTSNVGTSELAAVEERRDIDDEVKATEMQRVAMGALRNVFRPEFLNRLDEIVVYRRLGREQIRSIVEIQLKYLEARLARRELRFEITTAAKDLLGEIGWDPQFGARPLKRAIQRHLEDPLATRVLAGQLSPGDTIFVDRKSDGSLSFEARHASTEPSKAVAAQ